MNQKFRLSVTFCLENDNGDTKSLGSALVFDFSKPESMQFSVFNRTIRYSLLSVIRTAAYAAVLGWAGDPEFKSRIAACTEEEHIRVSDLSRVAAPEPLLEMTGP